MQVSTIDNEKTMNSREIAEYTGKEHKHIIRDIRKMLDDLGKDGPVLDHHREDKDARGYTTCFYLNRALTDVLLTGYSSTARLAVIKRWHELEAKQSNSLDAVRDPVLAAHIRTLMELDTIKTMQQNQAAELAMVRESMAVIEARTQPENKHFTVLGYSNLIGKNVDYTEASKIGRKCAVMSREQGLPIGDIKDPRFGKVHSYHESVLQAVFKTTN